MKIVTLLENNTTDPALIHKHGLSLYLESENRKILFDIGPDDAFITNAKKLGIDLAGVQYLIISHGHYDHGGALDHFARINQQAKIIMHKTAVCPRVAKGPQDGTREIGLKFDSALTPRLLLLEKNYAIDERALIVMDFKPDGFVPDGNRSLFEKGPGGELKNDGFGHEIALLIKENGQNIFVTGCSHSGIGNMMRTTRRTLGDIKIDYVIGGFHIYNPAAKRLEEKANIDTLIAELDGFEGTTFFTGHCTSSEGFDYLKQNMKNTVREIHSGSVINI